MADGAPDPALDATSLSRLRWRCRRGLLENDLFLERFLLRYGPQLTCGQARALNHLLELNDNDLLDLLLEKKTLMQVDSRLEQAEVAAVLEMLKEQR